MGKYDNVVQLPCSPHCTGRVDGDGKVVEVIGCWHADLTGHRRGQEEDAPADNLVGMCVKQRIERGETVVVKSR